MAPDSSEPTRRLCSDGSVLVSAHGRLPTDPCEYQHGSVPTAFGCNRLRCRGCGARVRSGPPGIGLRDAEVAPAVLYAAERWEDLPSTKPWQEARLYACACSLWQCRHATEYIDRDHDTPTAAQVPWWCDGHPAPELPIRLGELSITGDTDWAELVERVLHGACPRPLDPPIGGRDGPSIWLGWLCAYLMGLRSVDALSSALAERVADPDPLVRGRVLHFFMLFPRALGIERVLAEAEADVEKVALGYPIPELWTSPTLFEVIAVRLDTAPRRERDATDARAAAVLRRVMQVPLTRLSHADHGPTDPVAHQRETLAARGEDVTGAVALERLAEYRRSVASRRLDVVLDALRDRPGAFRDAELHGWIADHIVELAAAAPGRWQPYMNLLAGWFMKPALGHLIVIGGTSLITRRAVTVADFRAWLDQARVNHLWVNDAWVLTLKSVLDAEQERLAGAPPETLG